MAFAFGIEDLLGYLDRDRSQWHEWFREHGRAALAVDLDANNTGRIRTVGELVRHIFSAEKRYVQRSLQVPLMDTSIIPADDVEALFAFGLQSRRAMRGLLASFPDTAWDAPREMSCDGHTRTVTARRMIVQAVTHELRHWAQVATFLRQAGHDPGVHDFIA